MSGDELLYRMIKRRVADALIDQGIITLAHRPDDTVAVRVKIHGGVSVGVATLPKEILNVGA